MSICTQSQVNIFRESVNAHVPNSSRFLIVVVLHFPPEMNLSSRPCYHAIFLNGWDFIYVDSLGVTTGTTKEDESLRNELNREDAPPIDPDENQGSDGKPILEVDAKTWIAKGFGLNVSILRYQLFYFVLSFNVRHFRSVCH